MVDAGASRASDILQLAMFAPDRKQCGISDYSRNLIAALADLGSVELVRCLEPPESAATQSHLHALADRSSRASEYRTIGAALGRPPTQLIHIQHEYSLMGGVAPHRNQAASLYSTITVPAVITVHEIVNEAGSAVRRAAIRHMNRVNFLHPVIRAWIVHTDADKVRLAGVGANSDAIHVIPIGVPAVQSRVDAAEARDSLGLAGKHVVTLFGFLSSKKGHLDALDAIAILPDEYELIFAGGRHPDDASGYVDQLSKEIESRNLSQRVRVTGFLADTDLEVVIAATDLAIAPYHNSSGSASAAYLLAAGLPVIASDIPAFQEIEAQMPGTLDLISPHRPDLLSGEIQKVMGNPEQLQVMRSAATRYAAAHSYRSMAEATVKVYRSVLG